MRNRAIKYLATAVLAVLALGATIFSHAHRIDRNNPALISAPGNIAEGMYSIVGEASHRCLEIASNSCAAVTPLQIFDCDKSEISNNHKFNVMTDGSGN